GAAQCAIDALAGERVEEPGRVADQGKAWAGRAAHAASERPHAYDRAAEACVIDSTRQAGKPVQPGRQGSQWRAKRYARHAAATSSRARSRMSRTTDSPRRG